MRTTGPLHLIATLAALALVVGACAPAAPAAPAATATSAPAAQATPAGPPAPKSVKIGATLAVTGPFAPEWGPTMLDIMKKWVSTVNEEGGITLSKHGNAKVPIELVIYDDESKPDKSVELYERLAAQDKVDVFLGPSTSPITIAASAVADKLSIPMMGCEANDTVVFSRGLKWFAGVLELGTPWSETYFDLVAKSNAAGKTNYKTVGVVISDRAHTQDVGKGAAEFAKKAGLQVVATETVPFGTTDYSAVIPKLKAVDPDIVFLALWPAEAPAFIKQADELKLKPRELYSRFLGEALIKGAGDRLAEGVVGGTFTAKKWLSGTRADKVVKALNIDAYQPPWLAIKYTCLEALITAIQDTGTVDRAKIMETIRGYTKDKPIKATFGPLYFNWGVKVGDKEANGFGTQKPIVGQIQGGKQFAVWPEPIADAQHKQTARP